MRPLHIWVTPTVTLMTGSSGGLFSNRETQFSRLNATQELCPRNRITHYLLFGVLHNRVSRVKNRPPEPSLYVLTVLSAIFVWSALKPRLLTCFFFTIRISSLHRNNACLEINVSKQWLVISWRNYLVFSLFIYLLLKTNSGEPPLTGTS